MYRLELEYIKYDENMSPKDCRSLEHDVAYNLLASMLHNHFGITKPTVLKNENGKPYVNFDGVHFSISHTLGLVACVVADIPVGVDCELIKTKRTNEIEKFANRFFVENEIEFLKNSHNPSFDFLKIWTGKEATIKKQGSNMAQVKKIDTTKENLIYSYEKEYIICINI